MQLMKDLVTSVLCLRLGSRYRCSKGSTVLRALLGIRLFRFGYGHGWRQKLLREALKEPSPRSLPYLWRKYKTGKIRQWPERHGTCSISSTITLLLTIATLTFAHSSFLWQKLYTNYVSQLSLTSRCSLQILQSHTDLGRLLVCTPHLVHMF